MPAFKSKIDTHTAEVVVFARKTGEEFHFFMNKQVLSLQVEKDMFNPIGGCNFELKNTAVASQEFKKLGINSWEEVLSIGDTVFVSIDEKLKMRGLIMGIGYTSLLQKGKVKDTLMVKVSDMGILFSKFGKFITDVTWRVNQSEIGANFFEAFLKVMNEYNYDRYALKETMELSWNEIIGAYLESIPVPLIFSFSNGETFSNFSQNLFEGVSDRFDTTYPLTIHYFQENFADVWQFWTKLSNPPFTELFCDSVYKGQKIATFDSRKFITVKQDQYMVICRPNSWIGDNFETLKKQDVKSQSIGVGIAEELTKTGLLNEINPIKVYQVQASKSGAEIKSMFLVYPEGGVSPMEMKANGDFAIDNRFFSTWGIDIQNVPLSFSDFKKDTRSFAATLAGKLQSAYENIDKFYSGVVMSTYHDVRVGQAVKFRRRVGLEEDMIAMAVRVVDQLKSPASFHTQTTFVRGEIDKGLAGVF